VTPTPSSHPVGAGRTVAFGETFGGRPQVPTGHAERMQSTNCKGYATYSSAVGTQFPEPKILYQLRGTI